MNRALATAAAAVLAASHVLGAAPRHPLAVKAEASFFALLNDSKGSKEAVLRELTTAFAVDPTDPRTVLLVGLDHLWLAADGDRTDPMTIDHLVLAEHYLARAQELNPADERIPSWLVPARLGLAGVERRPGRAKEVYAELRAAYEARPAFHSFSVALVNSRQKPDSKEFQEGLDAIRQAYASNCVERKDEACLDAPRWPHNLEGFGLFAARYEAKAGNLPRAAELIARVKARPEYASWPHRNEALELEAAVDAALKGSSPASFAATTPGVTCQGCHGAR